jgi:putative ATPase
MTGKESDVVACPNCATEVSYSSLNTHLDQCLGLKKEKRPISTTHAEDSPMAKRSKQDDKTSRPTFAPQAHSNSTATTSRERLDSVAPLAERLRPKALEDFVGQQGVVGGPLKALLKRGNIPNAILWGPPGTGGSVSSGSICITWNVF